MTAANDEPGMRLTFDTGDLRMNTRSTLNSGDLGMRPIIDSGDLGMRPIIDRGDLGMRPVLDSGDPE